MIRRDKINYYLDIADTILERGTCLRRNYGAIIVKNDSIVSTGYTGAPRGCKNCCDLGFCMRNKLGIPSGQRYELCRSVHAEQNAIIAAPRENMLDAALYLSGKNMETENYIPDCSPCSLCRRFIINAGIKTVYCRTSGNEYTVYDVEEWIKKEDGLQVIL